MEGIWTFADNTYDNDNGDNDNTYDDDDDDNDDENDGGNAKEVDNYDIDSAKNALVTSFSIFILELFVALLRKC